MRLCAGLPCTLCLSTLDVKPNAPLRRSPLHPVPLNPDVKPNAPLRRSPLHPVPLNPDVKPNAPLRRSPLHPVPLNPDVKPNAPLRRSTLHLVPQSPSTTDMRLCAGQPCTSCLNPHQQPICASAPVNPAPRASIPINNRYAPLRRSTLHLVPQSPSTTDMRLCAGQPCTSCLNPHQQPICAPAPVNPAPRASSSTTTDMSPAPVNPASTMYHTVKHQSILCPTVGGGGVIAKPNGGEWHGGERSRRRGGPSLSGRAAIKRSNPGIQKFWVPFQRYIRACTSLYPAMCIICGP